MPEHRVVPAPVEAPSLKKNRLGVTSIVFFVIAAVAPLSGIVGGSVVVFAAGGASAPAVYILVGVLFAVFSVGYVAMSRHILNAGGFVAYVAQGLGRRAATALGGITMLGYVSLITAFWAFFGAITAATFQAFGLDLPPELWIFVFLCAVTFLTYRGIDMSLKILGTLLLLEMVAILVLDVAILVQGGDSGLSLAGFSPTAIMGPGAGIAFLIATTCFTGFEATVVFSEEARNPRRTIPRAVYASIAVLALFFAFTTWALSIGWGPDNAAEAAASDPTGFVFAMSSRYVGEGMTSILSILLTTSLLALFLGFQNMAARYAFALARAGVLPRVLSRADVKSGSPKYAAVAIGAVVALIIAVMRLFGADILTVIFSWLTALGTVCIIVGLVATMVAVIAFFARDSLGHGVMTTKVAPVVAGIGFALVGVSAIMNYDSLLGGTGKEAVWLLLLIPIAGIGGWAFASVRMRRGAHLDFASHL